jgi:hypothetical protein
MEEMYKLFDSKSNQPIIKDNPHNWIYETSMDKIKEFIKELDTGIKDEKEMTETEKAAFKKKVII